MFQVLETHPKEAYKGQEEEEIRRLNGRLEHMHVRERRGKREEKYNGQVNGGHIQEKGGSQSGCNRRTAEKAKEEKDD